MQGLEVLIGTVHDMRCPVCGYDFRVRVTGDVRCLRCERKGTVESFLRNGKGKRRNAHKTGRRKRFRVQERG